MCLNLGFLWLLTIRIVSAGAGGRGRIVRHIVDVELKIVVRETEMV